MVYYLSNSNKPVVCFLLESHCVLHHLFPETYLVFCCFVLLGQTLRFHSPHLCLHFTLQLFPLCISLEYKRNLGVVELHLNQRKKKRKKEKIRHLEQQYKWVFISTFLQPYFLNAMLCLLCIWKKKKSLFCFFHLWVTVKWFKQWEWVRWLNFWHKGMPCWSLMFLAWETSQGTWEGIVP